MKLYNLQSVYDLVTVLYGIEPDDGTFEDIALSAWELIGNKYTRLYRYIGTPEDDVQNNIKLKTLKLPCNVDSIESVQIPMPDAQMTSNKTVFNSIDTLFMESYIDAWKRNEDPYWERGKLLKYDEGNNELYFYRNYKNIMVIYHGIIVNEEDGLPLINQKEQKAIAAYVAYISLYKEGIKMRDTNLINLANTIKAEWLQRCNAARIPEKFSQNDMNEILDIKTRWDRKQYGKSFKPIL